MNKFKIVKISDFLTSREEKYKPDDDILAELKRLDKIDFNGNIHLSQKPTKTDMIIVYPGDLVISGINVQKGAIAVYHGKEPITATIHYSSYTFDQNKIDIEYFKRFLKSPEFLKALQEQVKGGIKTEIKPKTFLPIEIKLPNLIEQKKINKYFDSFEQELRELKSELNNQQKYISQLKQAILQEAISGQLTAEWRKQNPIQKGNPDTDAAALLTKIKAEKQQLIADGKLKKEKPLPPISPDEIPFSLPDSWVWCRFGEFATFERGRFSIRPRNDQSCFGGQYPFIQINSLSKNGDVITEYKQTLNEKGRSVSKEFPKGTLAIAIVGGTIGNLGVLGIDMCFTDSMVGVKPSETRNQNFTLLLLRYKQPEIKKAAYQMAGQPNIKIPTLTNLVIPLPPLAEQKAIVEKVDYLMKIINQLEAQIKHRKQLAEDLMQIVLREAFE